MHKKIKKKGIKSKTGIAILLIVIAIAALGIFIAKKPSITGLVVITREASHSDSLDLTVNESKNVTWNLRNPGNLQSIKATGAISRNGSAKVYIENGNERLLIFDSTKTLFDVNIQVLPDYKKIFQGEELLIQIVLFNLRGFGKSDVNITYSIKNPNGNLVAAEKEVVTVETQAKFVRKLLIPSNLKPGAYVAFVEVKTSDGLIGASSDLFEVRAKYEEKYPPYTKYYGIGLAATVALIIAVIFSIHLFKKLKRKKEAIRLKEKIPGEKIQKLEKELEALEGAYKSQLISEESYNNNRGRIETELKRLKGHAKEDAQKSKTHGNEISSATNLVSGANAAEKPKEEIKKEEKGKIV